MSTYSNRLQPALQNLLQCVVRFFHLRSSYTTYISADVQRITLNSSCMTISGGRSKQLDIFCRVTGFTSDFLSFVVVELEWLCSMAPSLMEPFSCFVVTEVIMLNLKDASEIVKTCDILAVYNMFKCLGSC